MKADDSELCVLLGLGAVLCAVPTSALSRLLLLEEAEPLAHDILQVDAQRFAIWDLAELLGFSQPAARSWLLLSAEHGTTTVPIALRVGQCLAVQPVTQRKALPQGLFRARGAGLAASFDPAAQRKLAPAVIGLYLDPRRLLSSEELDASMLRLKAA